MECMVRTRPRLGLRDLGLGMLLWGVGGQSSCEGWTKATHKKILQ